jgi:hypothetical protein
MSGVLPHHAASQGVAVGKERLARDHGRDIATATTKPRHQAPPKLTNVVGQRGRRSSVAELGGVVWALRCFPRVP